MIQTLGLVLLGILTLFLAGYGPALLLLDPKGAYPRAVAIPVLGLACYIILTHFLASLGLNGVWISRISPLLLGALVVAVPRDRRLERREITTALPVLAICCGALLMAGWPLLVEGCSSFMGFGNPDAAFNLAIFDGVQHHAYRDNLSEAVPYWPGPNFGFFFGAGYICVLLATLTGVDIFALHDVVMTALVFITPASVFIFSVVCLKATRRSALWAATATACSSLVCYTFFLQSFGAVTLISLLPAFLAACVGALETEGYRKVVPAALLFTGAIFGYYAAAPILVVLMGVAGVTALAQRKLGFRQCWRVCVAFAVLPLAAFPALTLQTFYRSLAESGSSRLVASLNGPELLLSFGFALTEQYLPFIWGLLIPPFTPRTVFEAPSWFFFGSLVLSALLSGLLLWCLLRRSEAPLTIRVQLSVLAAAIAYFVLRKNGYGAFKLAAWFYPLYASFLLCGVFSKSLRSGNLFRRLRNCLLAGLFVLNAGWSIRLGLSSLQDTTLTGKNMAGLTGVDFHGLSSLSKTVPADSRILMAIPDAVEQRWALTFLRRGNLSVVPLLSLTPELPDGSEVNAAMGAESSRYVLTSQPRRDITSSAQGPPIWQNSKFQLLPVDNVNDLLLIGRGWYRYEKAPQNAPPWQRAFRALRSYGELILLNTSGKEMRLRLTVMSGVGDEASDRKLSFALNGNKFDEITTAGVATVITKPFRPNGFLNRLSIFLPDSAKPIPRGWSLLRRWVPKDARRLNLVVLKVELLNDREYQALRLPCRLDLSRPEVWSTPNLNGIYPDHWIANKAHLSLEACREADSVVIQGFAPGLPASAPDVPVNVTVDGAEWTVHLDKPGPFTISVPLTRSVEKGSTHEISIGSPRSFVPVQLGLGPDQRRLSISLDVVEFHDCCAPVGSNPLKPAATRMPARSVEFSRAR